MSSKYSKYAPGDLEKLSDETIKVLDQQPASQLDILHIRDVLHRSAAQMDAITSELGTIKDMIAPKYEINRLEKQIEFNNVRIKHNFDHAELRFDDGKRRFESIEKALVVRVKDEGQWQERQIGQVFEEDRVLMKWIRDIGKMFAVIKIHKISALFVGFTIFILLTEILPRFITWINQLKLKIF